MTEELQRQRKRHRSPGLVPGAVFCLLLLLAIAGDLMARGTTCPTPEQMRPLLNSERIQSCFGSYGVEVLEQQGNLRITSLYSLEEGQPITRTLAISQFADDLPDSLQETYQAIRAGASMGATLQGAGWQVEKRLRFLGETPGGEAFRCMADPPADAATEKLAVQVYDLWVERQGITVRFALLAEVYDPRYLNLQDLKLIYPDQAQQLELADDDAAAILQHATEFCAAR